MDNPVEPNSMSPTNVRWCVAVWLAVVAAIAYLCRTSIGAAQGEIRVSLSLTEDQMGLVMGPAFFWPYALSQIPTAWLGQRYGSRRMLVLFTAGSSLAVVAFALSNSLIMLIAAWMTLGVSQAGMFPCATQTIARWHPITERARASGLLGGSMYAGSAIGMALAGVLIGLVGWRAMFLLFALPGFAWALGFASWFRNDPLEHPCVNAAERELITGDSAPREAATAASARHRTPWRRLIRSGTLWLICSQQFFRAGAQVFFATWFVKYLQETRGTSLQQSAWLSALPAITFMLGTFVAGGVSDLVLLRTGSLNAARKGVATITQLMCAAIVGGAWFVEDAQTAVFVISFGVFLAGFAGPVSYAATIDVGGRHAASIFSTMNMCGNFGAGLMPWVVPHYRIAIEGALGGTSEATRTSWAAVLLLFASMYLASAVCWTQLKIEPDLFDRE
jgi:sugar phosphate permease